MYFWKQNFEGRVHAKVKANYLASPPLVVAYAIAGHLDIDFTTDPIGQNKSGQPVYLEDIWPSDREISEVVAKAVLQRCTVSGTQTSFRAAGGDPRTGHRAVRLGPKFNYVRRPTFLTDIPQEITPFDQSSGPVRC